MYSTIKVSAVKVAEKSYPNKKEFGIQKIHCLCHNYFNFKPNVV
jgi:hypothetical protein